MKKSLMAPDWQIGDTVLKDALNVRTRQLSADHYRSAPILSAVEREILQKEIEAISRCIYVLDAAWVQDFEPGY